MHTGRPLNNLADLVWTLVRTDFTTRYHGTLGGFLWALLKPLTMFLVLMGVFSFVFTNTPQYRIGLILGLFLYASGRVGPGYWAILSGSGALFVAAIHFGPTAVEPPADIINLYEVRIVGWLAFLWLVVFVVVLVVTCLYELRSWFAQRETRRLRSRGGE